MISKIRKGLFLLVSFLWGLRFVIYWGNGMQNYYRVSLRVLAIGPLASMTIASLEELFQGFFAIVLILVFLYFGWHSKGCAAYVFLFLAVFLWFFYGCVHEFHYM